MTHQAWPDTTHTHPHKYLPPALRENSPLPILTSPFQNTNARIKEIEDRVNQLYYQNMNSHMYCIHCKIYKPPQCRHCKVCQHCVCRFDHHCNWLGVCIGKQNYFVFLQLLFTSCFTLLFFSLFQVCSFYFGPRVLFKELVIGYAHSIYIEPIGWGEHSLNINSLYYAPEKIIITFKEALAQPQNEHTFYKLTSLQLRPNHNNQRPNTWFTILSEKKIPLLFPT